MMVGLQGSRPKPPTNCKTCPPPWPSATSARCLIGFFSTSIARRRWKQLAVLGRDPRYPDLPIVAGQKPAQIARRALEAGNSGGLRRVLLDTAGRTTLDEEMMTEAAEIKTSANPHEVRTPGRGLAHRPGRGSTWRGRSTSASASPASC